MVEFYDQSVVDAAEKRVFQPKNPNWINSQSFLCLDSSVKCVVDYKPKPEPYSTTER